MKIQIVALAFLLFPAFSFSQDAASLIAEGQKLEQKLKEADAFAKYQQALAAQPSNILAAVKCAEMACSIGAREANKDQKAKFYNQGKDYAATAVLYGPADADANYAMAMACGKMTEVESSNSKTVEYVKAVKTYADKALSINANHAKSLYVLGKWHYEVLNLNMVKRAAVKVMYGGLAPADIDTCIAVFQKARTADPYSCMIQLGLAKAYYYNKEFQKALDVLQQCTKCPTLHQDDPTTKEEAKKLLVDWQ